MPLIFLLCAAVGVESIRVVQPLHDCSHTFVGSFIANPTATSLTSVAVFRLERMDTSAASAWKGIFGLSMCKSTGADL